MALSTCEMWSNGTKVPLFVYTFQNTFVSASLAFAHDLLSFCEFRPWSGMFLLKKKNFQLYQIVIGITTSKVGCAVTRSSLEREVWGSNLGPVKSDTVLPLARHRCDISSKGAVLPGRNDAEIGPANSLHASAYYSKYNERFDLNIHDIIRTNNGAKWSHKTCIVCRLKNYLKPKMGLFHFNHNQLL